MEIAPYITVDAAIHHGTPVITGTRVPISIIIGSLAGGMSKEEVMQEYDELSKTQVEAALSYATDLNIIGLYQVGSLSLPFFMGGAIANRGRRASDRRLIWA